MRDRMPLARALILVAALAALMPVYARVRADAAPTVALVDLPVEAREALARIRHGGPFRYDRDGMVFGNREHLLPRRPRGYYHEYAVPTRAERTRGARRIVCGGARAEPDLCYYTDDHYQSFRRIVE